jgi:hypothetical protein
MANSVYSSEQASYRAEIVFTRNLKERYGIDEVETDYDVLFFNGYPTESDLLGWIPDGWELVEYHVYPVDEDDTDDDYEEFDHPAFADNHYHLDDYWDEPEYVYDDELEVV